VAVNPTKTITLLALIEGTLVFLPFSMMKFMPENDWFWRFLVAVLALTLIAQLFVSLRFFQGRKRALALAASLGVVVFVLPILFLAGVVLSLVIGTFVLPPPG
jgi:ABC-type multidrug transport system permease subunit